MFRYETHLHTYPVSACAWESGNVLDTLKFYKSMDYDGVIITNHFIDGNINIERDKPYEERINYYFSDYEKALELSEEIGIKVFCGVEMSYKGTDFLVYGLDKNWYLAHPEIEEMKKSDELNFLRENGGFVIQAHPYREDAWIDHIRLFPRCVDGIEVLNALRPPHQNHMAEIFANEYNLLKTAGTDNHIGEQNVKFAGIETKEPINDIFDFINVIKEQKMNIFYFERK